MFIFIRFSLSSDSSEHDDLERACSLPLPDQMSALSSRKLSHSRLSPSLSSPHEGLESEKTMTVSRKMSSGEMINVLQSQVFGVTTEECQKALSRNEWNIAKSLNYLKVIVFLLFFSFLRDLLFTIERFSFCYFLLFNPLEPNLFNNLNLYNRKRVNLNKLLFFSF